MGVVMVMFRADGQRRNFSVSRDVTVLGRREDCDLRIPLGDVSRKHCRLIMNGQSLKVEDLGSSNGTFVNGERVQQAEINPGDTLQVGPVVFVLQIDGAPADEDLHPVSIQSTANAGTRVGEPSAPAGDEDVVDLETTSAGGAGAEDFDPMEALESAEGSAFDFEINEADLADDSSQQGQEQSHADVEESGQ